MHLKILVLMVIGEEGSFIIKKLKKTEIKWRMIIAWSLAITSLVLVQLTKIFTSEKSILRRFAI